MMRALETTPALIAAAEVALEATFGLRELRPWQRDAISALLEGSRRVLVVAPTGGGKSLTYQLPATVLPGTTLVLSPLVALMEDQVRSLHARGIAATFIASTLPVEERRAREEALARGEYKLVYAAPERLAYGGFAQLLKRLKPSLVAIDEAHCIAQWGHDFRPDYLRIGPLLEELAPDRVLACTATATPEVRREIIERLGFVDRPHDEILRGFARPNLHLSARWVDGPKAARKEIEEQLERALVNKREAAGAAIIYAATRKNTEELAQDLKSKGWRALGYHAGMPADTRTKVSSAFARKKVDVIVATNAFGMGIDRDDVRLVVHAQPPSSIEAYYQEVGRAGRDGDEAHGLLLCSGADISLRRRLVEMSSGDTPPTKDQIERNWRLFRELLTYLDACTCRHDFVLRYFGDEREVLGGCGHCDVCESVDDAPDEDATLIVKKALSGVARAHQRAGLAAIVSMLVGKDDERTRRFGFTELTTFGLFSSERPEWVTALLRALIAAGWVDLTATEHPVPLVTRAGWDVLKSQESIRLRLPPRTERKRKSAAKASAAALPDGDPLVDRLRAHRAEVAKKKRVPAYVIAHDRTLVELAARKPATLGELAGIHGLGPSRIENYGEGFLSVIAGA